MGGGLTCGPSDSVICKLTVNRYKFFFETVKSSKSEETDVERGRKLMSETLEKNICILGTYVALPFFNMLLIF